MFIENIYIQWLAFRLCKAVGMSGHNVPLEAWKNFCRPALEAHVEGLREDMAFPFYDRNFHYYVFGDTKWETLSERQYLFENERPHLCFRLEFSTTRYKKLVMKIYPSKKGSVHDYFVKEIAKESMQLLSQLIQDSIMATPAKLLPIALRTDTREVRYNGEEESYMRLYMLFNTFEEDRSKFTFIRISSCIKKYNGSGHREIELYVSSLDGWKDAVDIVFSYNDRGQVSDNCDVNRILQQLSLWRTPGIKWFSVRKQRAKRIAYAILKKKIQKHKGEVWKDIPLDKIPSMVGPNWTLGMDSSSLVEFIVSWVAKGPEAMNDYDEICMGSEVFTSERIVSACMLCLQCGKMISQKIGYN